MATNDATNTDAGALLAAGINNRPTKASVDAALATKAALAGTQTFTGTNTFSSAPNVPDGAFPPEKVAGLTTALASTAKVWIAGEAVTAGTIRVAPDGSQISRIANGTTGSVFDSTEQAAWSAVVTKTGTISQVAIGAAYENMIPVTRLGVSSALPDTDQSVAIQAAIDLGVPLFFPSGRYVANGLLARSGMHLAGAGKGDPDNPTSPRTILRTVNGDLFAGGAPMTLIENMELQGAPSGTPGHLVTGLWSQGVFRTVRFLQYNPEKSCVTVTGWLDMSIEGASEILGQPNHTVPAFKALSGSGYIAQNSFRDTRFRSGGGNALSPEIWMEAVNGGASVITGLTISNCNFESPHGGCMRLLSVRAVHISGSGAFDLAVAAVPDMIFIGASPTAGAASGQITIDGWNRDTTTPPSGMDIRAESTTFDLNIIGPGHQSGEAFNINAGGAKGRILGTRGTLFNAQNMTTDTYQNYAPTVTPTVVGDGTLTGKFKRTGDTVHALLTFTVGATPNVGEMRFSAPFATPVGGSPVFAIAKDASTGIKYQLGGNVTGGEIVVQVPGTNGVLSNPTSTTPFTWAVGDNVTVDVHYRV